MGTTNTKYIEINELKIVIINSLPSLANGVVSISEVVGRRNSNRPRTVTLLLRLGSATRPVHRRLRARYLFS